MSYQYGKYQQASLPPSQPPPSMSTSTSQEKKKEILKNNVKNESVIKQRSSSSILGVGSRVRSTSSDVAPFIQLLWKIMNDESNRVHIYWSLDGLKIKINNPHLFSYVCS